MLQKALHRARRISAAARVMVTADEVHRALWQPTSWFMRAEHRFVSESPGMVIAHNRRGCPFDSRAIAICVDNDTAARCYVADEWTLTVALHRVLSERSFLADGIVTLGWSARRPASTRTICY